MTWYFFIHSFIHSFIHFNSGSKAHKQQTEAMTYKHTHIKNTERQTEGKLYNKVNVRQRTERADANA